MRNAIRIAVLAAVICLTAAVAVAYVPMETKPAPPEVHIATQAEQVMEKIAADVTKLYQTAIDRLQPEEVNEVLERALGLYFNQLIAAQIVYEVYLQVDVDGPTKIQAYIKLRPSDEGYQHIWLGKKPENMKRKEPKPKRNSKSFNI